MDRTVKITLTVIAALIVFGVIILAGVNNQTSPKSSNSPASNNITNTPTPKDKDELTVITYTNKGFVPDSYTVSANTYVKLANNSTKALQLMSDPHETHLDNPELNLGKLNPGSTTTFYVTQKGNWGFHNDANITETGTLVVQ